MPDYIERGAACAAMPDDFYGWRDKQLLKSIPTADVRPVVRASWKRIDYKPCGHDYECSSCGWKNDMETHFCPNCGANMRGESMEGATSGCGKCDWCSLDDLGVCRYEDTKDV